MRRLLAALLLLLATPLALAQTAFPTKTIRIIVPFNAGSGSDSYSRFYAELLNKMYGWSVTVENRPGGSGVVAINAVKGAPADGHTLLLTTNTTVGKQILNVEKTTRNAVERVFAIA